MNTYPTLEFLGQYKEFLQCFDEINATRSVVTAEGYLQWLTHRHVHEALLVLEEIEEKIIVD